MTGTGTTRSHTDLGSIPCSATHHLYACQQFNPFSNRDKDSTCPPPTAEPDAQEGQCYTWHQGGV